LSPANRAENEGGQFGPFAWSRRWVRPSQSAVFFSSVSWSDITSSVADALYRYVDYMTYIGAIIVILVAFVTAANKIWRLNSDATLRQSIS
jgi:hypothetical protein